MYDKYLAGGWANLTNQHSMGVDLGATSTFISRLLRPQEGGRGHLCQGGLLGALPGVWDEIGADAERSRCSSLPWHPKYQL